MLFNLLELIKHLSKSGLLKVLSNNPLNKHGHIKTTLSVVLQSTLWFHSVNYNPESSKYQ